MRYLTAVGRGIGVTIFFLILSALCLGISSVAEYYGSMRIAFTLHDGAIAIGILGFVVAVLVVYSGCVTENANSQPKTNIIVVGGGDRNHPQTIPYNPYQSLPRGEDRHIPLDRQSVEEIIEEIISAIQEKNRYLPSGDENKDRDIEIY